MDPSKALVVLSDKKTISNVGDKLWRLINSLTEPSIKRDLKGDPVLNKRIRHIVEGGIEIEFYEVLDSLGSKEKMKHALSFIAEDQTNILATIVRVQPYISQDVFHRLIDKVLSINAPLIPTPECLKALSTGSFDVIRKILNLIEDPDQPFTSNEFNGNPLYEKEIFFRYFVNKTPSPAEDVLVHGQYWLHQTRSSDHTLPIYVWWKETLSVPEGVSIVPSFVNSTMKLLVEFDNFVEATIPYFDTIDQDGVPLWKRIEGGLMSNALHLFPRGRLTALIEAKKLDSDTPFSQEHSNTHNRRLRL